MPFTAHTLIDPDALRSEFAEIRRTGIAFDREECMDGLRCIGAPVFGADGACIGGIDVMFPTYRVTAADESRFVPLVRQAAADISVGMGFDPTQIQYSEE